MRVSQLRESKRTGQHTTGARYNDDVEFHTPRLQGGGSGNDAELQKAIEESKKTALLEEKRRKQDEGSYVICIQRINACLILFVKQRS